MSPLRNIVRNLPHPAKTCHAHGCRIFVGLGVFLFSVGVATAAQRDLSLNPQQLLRELNALEERRNQTMGRARAAAFEELRKGASGGFPASNLYADAIRDTRFEGRRDRTTAFSEWRREQGELLRSSDFQNAIATHLLYLMLTMERMDAEDPEKMVQPSLEYLGEVIPVLNKADGLARQPDYIRDFFERPVGDSLFTRWMSLQPWLYTGGDWEQTPGNVAGILDKNIRPELRRNGDHRLLDTYELQMEFETRRAGNLELEHERERFQRMRRPRILFARATDLSELGMPNRAASEILQIARDHPDHPDFDHWIQTIREILSKPEETDPPQEMDDRPDDA